VGDTIDERAFDALFGRHRRELHVHCYRMLGSFEQAEDAVQEVFLRAWRARASVDDGSFLRAWLYRIATNTCIDQIRRSGRKVAVLQSFGEVPWLEPYPDVLLDGVVDPETATIERETIELAYLAVIQLLPPSQRAVLLLRDVLGWSAAETARILETSVAGANSALQRARATLRDRLPEDSGDWSAAAPTDQERELLARFVDAHERMDVAASVALLRDDVRVTMPPYPSCYDGIDAVVGLIEAGSRMGEWRLVATAANRMPAAASYLRQPGDSEFRAFKLDVIRVDGGKIAELTTFGAGVFASFGLPDVL
jgi:RNA polymerase sigma-70 factor (ECF subfamily)